MKRFPTCCAAALLLLCVSPLWSADWLQFRGPDSLGKSDETGLPVKWSSTENIDWRTKLPGAGSSSPIVVGQRIVVTCYSGYGTSREDPGDQQNLMRHVVCLDRNSGKILWQKDFKPLLPESRYRGNGAHHGYSTSTPTSDGENVFIFFGKSGVYCLKLADGSEVWHTSVGTGIAGWGSATSPVLYKNILIVNAAVESRSLVGLDKNSGKEIWRTDGIRSCWSSPVLVKLPAGGVELVLNTPRTIRGFDPQTGKELWTCEGIPDGYVCPTVVAHNGVVYAIGGRRNTAVAVKAGGLGDVTKTRRLWSVRYGSNVASPVYDNGYLYWVHEGRGTAYCLNAKTGAVVYQQRLRPRPGRVYSSVTLADGKLYCFSQYNGAFVLAAGPKFRLLAHNVLEDDKGRCNAIPVVSRGQLLLRTDNYLYCIGRKAAGE